MRTILTRILLLCVVLAPAARAQRAHWDPPGGTLPVGQATALQLVLEDCEAKDIPVPPKSDGLSISYTGNAGSSMSWVNGTFSRSVTYTYSAILSKSQAVEIPSFEIETKKGRVRVPSAHFDPTGATVGSGGPPLESAASSHFIPSPSTVWAGQVFDLDYRIQAGDTYVPQFAQAFAWKAGPIVTEDWTVTPPALISTDTGQQVAQTYHTRAIVETPGRTKLNTASHLVNLSIGVAGLGFFPQRQYQQFSVTSDSPSIDVRPLPPSPAGFSGAVGDFKFTSKVVPEKARVGDPITWTLELSGHGNWPSIPALPARDVSRDFQVIQPKAKRTMQPGKLFDGKLTEDVVLVPTQAGAYHLGPVSFTYFDPQEGAYRTITASGTNVSIDPAPEAPTPVQAPQAAPPVVRPPATPPQEPNGLPRDVLAESGATVAPMDSCMLASLLLAPAGVLLVLWLWHALRRARKTDPKRIRREAHSRLAETVARIRSTGADAGAVETLLAAWMRDAAILWEIEHAAPSSGVFTARAASLPSMDTWAALWTEAERAVYGPHRSLPADWAGRAEAALVAKPAPRFTRTQLFLPRNLFPWLYTVMIAAALGLGVANRASADEGAAAYRRGNFPDAEKAWRSVVASEPTDWSARHNLSLSLSQENRWGEAAAQACAAFVQQPQDEAVRWQFTLACDKAEVSPTSLGAFLAPGPLQSLARLQSPAQWKITLVVAAWIVAAALAALLWLAYGSGRGRWRLPAACILLAAGTLLGAASVAGWLAYGPAADSRAVVTWRDCTLDSIPTEADTSQKTAPLSAGTVAVEEKSFLGWVRLSFDNGQTGWVRREEIVPLWR